MTNPSAHTLRSTVRKTDALASSATGLRARPLRSTLSILGIAIGIAAITAVLGITQSSQADLLAKIDRLGTNLLTVVNGRSITGVETQLPATATAMIRVAPGVLRATPTAEILAARVYRTDKVPSYASGGLDVRAVDSSLPGTLNTQLADGQFLTAGADHYPLVVLGATAAATLGITQLDTVGHGGPTRIWIENAGVGHWFTVIGILRPLDLAPEIDRSALVSFPMAATDLYSTSQPSRIYVRANQDTVPATADLLGRTANPENPDQVAVSRPSDALVARVAVRNAGTSLYLGLGAITLLVGGIGVANIMVISVLERRTEIGLRRALGARRTHVATQFLLEAVLLSTTGGILGVTLGISATMIVALLQNWMLLIPPSAIWAPIAVATTLGGIAGIYPAFRATQIPPSQALRGP
ncbi:ABC transporter permease [Rathayibacter soli]|uniref:ABC transporter permease n=1 Tax=Rathayibacter soli TaxID=3144168 RepID=UPI0027E5A87D|nr:FtsX-like permease family protein [Glaciibacter superstes]